MQTRGHTSIRHANIRRAAAIAVGLIAVVGLLTPRSLVAYMTTARGTWVSSDGELTGTWDAAFDTAGGQLGGSMTVQELPGVSEGHITGTVNGAAVAFTLSKGNTEYASFFGTLSGTSLDGAFHSAGGASGRWHGTTAGMAIGDTERTAP